MSVWSPTHAQFTVLRARNLLGKGKGGNNDVFVTIQLGKEKYQTSTIKCARNPEWFEECDLPIPHLHTEIEVNVYHRGVLSDDFLGFAAIPLWEQKIQEQPKTQWVPLKHKPSKEPDDKYRGEIEVKVTFHCHSRVDFPAGLKKRSSSIRNLATVVGDKLKFARSKSFRENRKDPEGGKPDKNQNQTTPAPAVSEDGLSRSYSMSAAYVKSMSLDRGRVRTFANQGQDIDISSHSLYNVPGNRHSMVELPSTQLPPPPYHMRPSSQDDMNMVSGFVPPLFSRRPVSSAPYLDSVLRREKARYESIRERTEPESSSSDEDPRQQLYLPSRMTQARALPQPVGEEGPINSQDANSVGFLNASQGVNSYENTPALVESGEVQRSDVMNSGEGQRSETMNSGDVQRSETVTNGSLHLERGGLSSSLRKHGGSEELIVNGEVRLRKRTKRDRLRTHRQGARRFTVQGLEGRIRGLYDDSLSDPSDSSRPEIPDDLFSVYRNMTKEELLRVVIQNKAQLIRKDQLIKDLENYIDSLLVRVMETQPRILHRPPVHSQR